MSIIKKTVLFLLLGICFMSGSTLAVLIEQDWKVPGDKLLTVDTATGLKWLDITQTLNQSYDAVSAKLVAGQPLAGFKYATLDEIVKFWSDAGIPDINMGFTAANYEPVLALEKLVGFSPVPNQVPSRSIAISGSAAGQGSHFLAALAITQIGPLGPKLGGAGAENMEKGDNTLADNKADPTIGSWLVVPEPSTSSLMLLGFISLAFMTWKRHLCNFQPG